MDEKIKFKPSTPQEPDAPGYIRIKIGDPLPTSEKLQWKILGISKDGVLVKPVGVTMRVPGKIRDGERKRHSGG